MAKYKRAYKREVYNIPDEEDLRKRQLDIDEISKHVDSEGRALPKKMLAMFRSCVRQVWMKSPTKLYFLNSRKTPDYDPNTRRLWKYQCDCCHEWFKQGEVEVDHIKGEHPLKTSDDLQVFYESILDVSEEDLQLLCKPCHQIKTLAERKGISFEEAVIEKEVIDFLKLKASKQHSLIKKLKLNTDDVYLKSPKNRENIYRQYIKEKIANE